MTSPRVMIHLQGPIPAPVRCMRGLLSGPMDKPRVELHRSLMIATFFHHNIDVA